MSVKRCNRNGCQNVMCDRYSEEYGYICIDCFNELKEHLIRTPHYGVSNPLIDEFMTFPKGYREKPMNNLQEIQEVLDVEFPINLEE